MGNQAFISAHPHSVVEYLPPGISDHSPLKVIRDPPTPTGPKPFKYFEAWESHPSFISTVYDAWKVNISGSPLFRFVKKLANVKRVLKCWKKEVFGPIHHNLSICKKALEDAQFLLHQNPRDPIRIAEEKVMCSNYYALLSQEEKFARQKSRKLRLEAGNSNTKFFYNSIKTRSVINSISRLRRPDGTLCSDPDEASSFVR
ncbi:hypothetical protein QJS10_CPA05g01857 [Acorus calamus]|uniref:Uncharacterized protein n=1 Tax=Acorus calamus TaxID=4465 RepID=A0AAV9EXJ9_ACOCL|nr:hypothetical protein QJS10_CPA05g01857 [Acorus calamus]